MSGLEVGGVNFTNSARVFMSLFLSQGLRGSVVWWWTQVPMTSHRPNASGLTGSTTCLSYVT